MRLEQYLVTNKELAEGNSQGGGNRHFLQWRRIRELLKDRHK